MVDAIGKGTAVAQAEAARHAAEAAHGLKGKTVSGATHGAPPLEGAGHLPQMAPPDAAHAGAVASNLQSLPAISFSLSQIINLVLELANQMHKTERQETMQEADAALAMGEEAADDLKASASDVLIGAAIGASMKIIGAGISLGGAAKTGDIADSQTVMNKMMGYQAASQLTGSVGEYGDGTMKYEGQIAQSDKEVHEAQGQRLKSVEDSERQDAAEEQQLVQSIIQTLEKQEESRHEAVRATA